MIRRNSIPEVPKRIFPARECHRSLGPKATALKSNRTGKLGYYTRDNYPIYGATSVCDPLLKLRNISVTRHYQMLDSIIIM